MIRLVLALLALTLAAPALAQTRFTVTVTGPEHAPDVILIPGLVSSGAVWDATVKQLSPTHRVHVIQVRGFAGEPAGPNAEGPVLAPLIEEITAYAAKLDRPAIIGHSVGGLIALEAAASAPGKIDRIMIVDAYPFYGMTFGGPAATEASIKPMAAQMLLPVASMTDDAFAKMQGDMGALVKSEANRPTVLQWSLTSDRRVMAQLMYEDAIDDARPRLPKITAKTTILYAWDEASKRPGYTAAGMDQTFTSSYATLAGAKFRRIDDARHFLMLDQPEAFAREVDAFLK